MALDLCIETYGAMGASLDLQMAKSLLLTSSSLRPSVRRERSNPNSVGQLPHPAFVASVKRAADRLPIDEAHALWLVDVCGHDYIGAAAESGVDRERFAERVATARRRIRREVG